MIRILSSLSVIILSTSVLGADSKLDKYIRKAGAEASIRKEYWPNGKISVLATDTNGDKAADVFDYFDESGQLTKRSQDRNFDGKIDENIFYPKKGETKFTIERDEKFNGHFDEREQWEDHGTYIAISKSIRVTPNGEFKRKEIHRVPAHQEQEGKDAGCNCHDPQSTGSKIDHIIELSTIALGVETLGDLKDGYYSTNYGFKIEKECVDALGALRIDGLIQNMLGHGISCQWALGTTQAHLNVHKIISLLYDTAHPINLTCSEGKDMPPNQLGTSVPVQTEKDYPKISINLDKMLKDEKLNGGIAFSQQLAPSVSTEKVFDQITKTIFHELMHLTGYLHFDHVEYPYTCTSCCFETDGSNSLGCKICKGQYTSIDDKKYVSDVVDFFIKDKHPEFSEKILKTYLLKHPQERWARFKLVEFKSQPYSSLTGAALASALEERYKDITPDERKIIKAAQDISDHPYKNYYSVYKNAFVGYIDFLDGKYSESKQDVLKFSIPEGMPVELSSYLKDEIGNQATILYDFYDILNETETDPVKKAQYKESMNKLSKKIGWASLQTN